MLIVTIFCEPRNDVTIRPVNLESVGVLVVNMVLRTFGTVSDACLLINKKRKGPYVDRHLVYMDTLLDAELRDNNIEGSF